MEEKVKIGKNEKKQELYPPNMFTCTNRVNFKEYFSKFTQLIQPSLNLAATCSNSESKHEAYFANLGSSQDDKEREKILSDTSVEKFTIYEEKNCKQKALRGNILIDYKIPEKARNLKIVNAKEKWNHRQLTGNQVILQKHRAERIDLRPYEEIVVTIKVYNPFISVQNSAHENNTKNATLSHEVTILGTQKLTELRDKLVCASDLGYTRQIPAPKECLDPTIKFTYPSGFIFIENCFYNDMRHPQAIDYSGVIREWARRKNFVDFTHKSMNDVLINELEPRFGYPYLYQHQGDCEHILIFSEAHLLSPSEPLNRCVYPYISRESREHSLLCFICARFTSKFLVVDSERLPHKYTYLCENCLKSYNYSADGAKLGSFTLYPYFDRSAILFKK